MKNFFFIISFTIMIIFSSCKQRTVEQETVSPYSELVNKFALVDLEADLSHLSANDIDALKILFKVADIMNELFWIQAYGNKEELKQNITDEYALKYINIHYGPWDRLNNMEPFIEGYRAKSPGANFYPLDMTKEEFEAWDNPIKTSQYTMIRRNQQGQLEAIWYKDYFSAQIKQATDLLKQAAELVSDQGFKNYLLKRAEAMLSDNYFESDIAWMEMRTSPIDFIVGPIENYEDKLFGYKTAYQAFILIKDIEWSKKLERYSKFLAQLQAELPVDKKYKRDVPGSGSDINVYQAIYYAGDCNSGAKTIAINLPNDERVQTLKGSRKLQLKNSMKAKFDKILVPISGILIAEEQRQFINFDAFFENVMFHEVAHGMGIKNVVGQNNLTVRHALKDAYAPIEEAKADIMALFLISKLREKGEITEGELMNNFVTFVAGTFRSVRFGASSAHGKANMMSFNYLLENKAIEKRNDGTYFVNYDKMYAAVLSYLQKILVIQGDGNYDLAVKMIETQGKINQDLQNDLNRVNEANIPVDIVFNQGKEVLNLK